MGSSTPSYHQQVVEEEDLALVQAQFLGLVGVRDLEQSAVAHQPAVRQRQDLRRARRDPSLEPAQGTGGIFFFFFYTFISPNLVANHIPISSITPPMLLRSTAYI